MCRRSRSSKPRSAIRAQCASDPSSPSPEPPPPATTAADQARDALRRIETALAEAGASLSDVVRTRMFVTDISRWREVGAVHAEVFGDIRPVATMVEVSALISPELMVEIEVDAYVAEASGENEPSALGPIGRDTRHSADRQRAVQMREQHRLRDRSARPVPSGPERSVGRGRCAAAPDPVVRRRAGWPADVPAQASRDG